VPPRLQSSENQKPKERGPPFLELFIWAMLIGNMRTLMEYNEDFLRKDILSSVENLLHGRNELEIFCGRACN